MKVSMKISVKFFMLAKFREIIHQLKCHPVPWSLTASCPHSQNVLSQPQPLLDG